MSFLQTLASSIRSFWDVNTKTLVITDLTFMSADEVCIAGIDEQLTCVRPVVPHGIRRRQLFGSGRLIIFPRAKVAFDLSPAPIAPPHIEDQQFNRDCPDQTDSSNHVTLWDGSNYKRAA